MFYFSEAAPLLLLFFSITLSIESRSFFPSKKKLRSGLQWLTAVESLHLETVPFTLSLQPVGTLIVIGVGSQETLDLPECSPLLEEQLGVCVWQTMNGSNGSVFSLLTIERFLKEAFLCPPKNPALRDSR